MTYVQEKFYRLVKILERVLNCEIMYKEHSEFYKVYITSKDKLQCNALILEKSKLVCYSYDCLVKGIKDFIQRGE